jgi:antitoxin (DNA-binding transcriptional repressor) of toxin-antitoxin stability system
MSAITMNVTEFATKVAEVIANLKYDEEVIITGDHNQIVAKLIPANKPAVADAKPNRRQLGLSDSIIWISPDFDEPLEDFKEYMP